MTTYYVGPGGDDTHAGTAWSTRFLTVSKAATSVAAGDTVYVGPGTYKELLTISTSGSAGNVISWIGDYLGTNTDGVGGIVRLSGATANDQSTSRNNCITATTKTFNNFTGFLLDGNVTGNVNLSTGCTDMVFDKCILIGNAGSGNNIGITMSGLAQANITIQNCVFIRGYDGNGITFTHTADVAAANALVQNCIFIGPWNAQCIASTRVRGITVKNCYFQGATNAIKVITEGSAGATHFTVNNCIIYGVQSALSGVATGDIVEDYNSISSVNAARINTATGANSNTFINLLDSRWFFQLVYAGAGPNGATQVVSPFDLASFSALVNVAGTSPSTTDMRGTAAIGGQREWGALEYDSTLKIQGSASTSSGGLRRPIAGGLVVS